MINTYKAASSMNKLILGMMPQVTNSIKRIAWTAKWIPIRICSRIHLIISIPIRWTP